MLGSPCPTDMSDESLRRYFKTLYLLLHPDKHGEFSGKPHGNRLVHFYKILNEVYDTYSKTTEKLEPPDAAYFEKDEEADSHNCDKPPHETGKSRSGRRVYLITFSHPHCAERRAPSEFSRKEFAELLLKAYQAAIPGLSVAYMAVFQELHQSGTTDGARNTHFHVAVKSSRQHPWAPIADYLRREHRVFVHFAMSGEGYASAFRYGWHPSKRKPLAELDKNFLLVDGAEAHPTPEEASKRKFWTGKKQKFSFDEEEAGSSSASSSSGEAEEDNEAGVQQQETPHKTRREPVWAYAFRLIRDHNIKTGDAFAALAEKLDDARLLSLCMQRQAGSIVERALHLLEAEARLKRSQLSCLEILQQAAESPCTCARPGDWKAMALELLRLQKISPAEFAGVVLTAIRSGSSKGANVFIHGTTTSGKSWIVDPLRVIYKCHLTPPKKSGFPLQELPLKEVILWQDFRHDEDVLSWGSLLLLFEGTEITIRRPRTEYLGDVDYKVRQPVFVTSAAPMTHPGEEEQKMMDVRFHFIHFGKTVPSKQVRKVPPCGACFASLWLSFSTPPLNVPQLCSENSCGANTSHCQPSQGASSSNPELPRSDSSSSTVLLYCGDCGLTLSSSPFCRATGQRHA